MGCFQRVCSFITKISFVKHMSDTFANHLFSASYLIRDHSVTLCWGQIKRTLAGWKFTLKAFEFASSS